MDKNLAIKTLKSFVEKTDNVIMKDAILVLHPELAESEDEKIMEEIISFIKGGTPYYCPNSMIRQKWATYLEKLKGQNDVPSRETIFGIWELGNLWKENPEEREGLTQLQYIQKYWLEKCDYMKEQKSMEKIEPKFKIGDKVCAISNRFECTIEYIDETTYYGDTTNFDIKDQDEWKLISKREQQSAEWSEDEKIRKHIIDIIKDNAKSKCIPCDVEISYLEKQKDYSFAFDKESYKSAIKKGWDYYVTNCDKEHSLNRNFINPAYDKGFRDGYRFGVHEEKPLVWTTHDEAVREEAISCLEKWGKKFNIGGVDYDNILSWLKEELSIHKETQNPTELSEDEKIRKALLCCCDDWEKGQFGCMVKEDIPAVRAWLEKQKTSEAAIRYLKENHSSEKVSDFQAAMNIAVARAYDKGVQDTLEKQKEPLTPEEKMKHPLYVEGFEAGKQVGAQYEAVFGKQKEQKTRDESGTAEPDYGICDSYVPAALQHALKRHGWYACCIEEDDEIIKERRDYVARNWPADKDALTQDKQPAEWSEEDKGMLGKVFECIRFAEDHYQLEEEEMNDVSVKSWLLDHVNPQPHWKPSEEQMKILRKYVIGDWRDLIIGQDKILTSLYSDLQKHYFKYEIH